MKKISALLLAMVMGVSMLSGCGKTEPTNKTDENAADTSLEDIKAKGKFVVGLDATFAPMGFTDENGDIVGFDIDLAKAAAEKMGVSVEFLPIDWDSKSMELASMLSGTASQSAMNAKRKFSSRIRTSQQVRLWL